MKYKALFLDLDGTTIPNKPDGMPSKRVTDAIHKAKPYIHVCIATSRPLFLAKQILDHLDISGLCVVNDATQIYSPSEKKFLQTFYLEKSIIPDIVSIIKNNKLSPVFNTGDDERILKVEDINKNICVVFVNTMPPKVADKLISELSIFSNIAVHKIPSWTKGEICVSITHSSATKLHGVTTISEMLNINPKEMIGVGDGYNDFPLLMACGLKIAMGNAVLELKAIADFIAPSVEEDGVATVIEKFILAF